MGLQVSNYNKGFLVDDEWMAGISENPRNPGVFLAYILDTQLGETIAAHTFDSLEKAIEALNKIERNWTFEEVSRCGSEGGCKGSRCGSGCKGEVCPVW